MSQSHQETQARPARAPRWVSPWTHDDEWEDEQRRHLKASQPPTQKAQDSSVVPPPPIGAKSASVPAIVSLVQESQATVADWVEIDEAHLLATSPDKAAKKSSFELTQAAVTEESLRHSDRRTEAQTPVKPAPCCGQPGTAATPSTSPNPPLAKHATLPKKARNKAASSSAWGTAFMTALGLAGAALLGWIYFSDISAPLDDDLILRQPVDLAPKIVGPERLSTFLEATITIPDLVVQSSRADG